MTITPDQCRAARALIQWSQDDLATATAGAVAKRSLVRFENEDTQPHERTAEAIRSALERAGVIFIDQNGQGPGVRLRRFEIGDRVRLRPGSMLAFNYVPNIGRDEIGTVVDVEPHPPQTGPSYRMSVGFPLDRKIEGAFEFEFRRAPVLPLGAGEHRGLHPHLKVWNLLPLKAEDPRWSSSAYKGPCRVIASTEMEAREIAAGAFARARRAHHGDSTPFSPWIFADIVSCEEESDQYEAGGPSRVIVPDPEGY